jgi:hypothetical protein
LEGLLGGTAAAQPELEQHLKSCAHCQTEFELLKTFYEGAATDSEDVRAVTAELRRRSKEIFRPQPDGSPRERWWRRLLSLPWLAPSALGAAAVLLVAAVVVQYRDASPQPVVNETNPSGREVFRSANFALIGPTGDVSERPSEIRWETVQSATKYQVGLTEVDGAEVWKAETLENHAELPTSVQDRIVPAKTLFCEVTAFDSSGAKVGETGAVRFRWLRSADR